MSPDVFAIRVLHFRTGGSISIGMAHPAAQQHRTATDAELDAALESVHRDFGGVLQRLAR